MAFSFAVQNLLGKQISVAIVQLIEGEGFSLEIKSYLINNK